MMKTLKYTAFLLLLSFAGCIEDNSKFGGVDIGEIKIEGIEEKYQVEFGSVLKISPQVTVESPVEADDLTYLWVKYDSQQPQADTLSREKELDVVIDDVQPGVTSQVSLKVTDTRTGIFAIAYTRLTTVGIYSGGTMMLCRTGSEYDLSFIKENGEKIYENIYSRFNDGEKLPTASKRLFMADGDARNTPLFKAVIVTSLDNTGGVYVDPQTLIRKNTMREKFVFGDELPDVLDISYYTIGSGADFVIVNGLVYRRPNYGETYKKDLSEWYPPTTILSDPKDYFASPCAAFFDTSPLSGKPVFYDQINGRMIYTASGGYFVLITGANHNTTFFDPNNLGAGTQMVMNGTRNSVINEAWALMRGADDGLFLITYKIEFNNSIFNFISQSRTDLAQGDYPALYDMTAFAPGTKYKVDTNSPWRTYSDGESGFFFFVSGNKVYAFNVENRNSVELIDGAAENVTITGIDCTRIPGATDAETYNQLTLTVKDNSLSSLQAGIAVYRLNVIGGLSATKLFSKTGFCDEILSTIEKIN